MARYNKKKLPIFRFFTDEVTATYLLCRTEVWRRVRQTIFFLGIFDKFFLIDFIFLLLIFKSKKIIFQNNIFCVLFRAFFLLAIARSKNSFFLQKSFLFFLFFYFVFDCASTNITSEASPHRDRNFRGFDKNVGFLFIISKRKAWQTFWDHGGWSA